jgi:hypothetical protein
MRHPSDRHSLSEPDDPIDDRRTSGRARIAKAASLFFSGHTGERSCDVNITDITEGGAGIKTQGLTVLPLTFDLSFDNLRRKCRLVWRKGNFFGVAFENHSSWSDRETQSGADILIPGPALLALDEPSQAAYFEHVEGWSEYNSNVSSQKLPPRQQLPFTAGVAIALSVPVFIGMAIYIATTAILRAG